MRNCKRVAISYCNFEAIGYRYYGDAAEGWLDGADPAALEVDIPSIPEGPSPKTTRPGGSFFPVVRGTVSVRRLGRFLESLLKYLPPVVIINL